MGLRKQYDIKTERNGNKIFRQLVNLDKNFGIKGKIFITLTCRTTVFAQNMDISTKPVRRLVSSMIREGAVFVLAVLDKCGSKPHFHIITDIYYDLSKIRDYWTHGYIDVSRIARPLSARNYALAKYGKNGSKTELVFSERNFLDYIDKIYSKKKLE